MTRLESLKGLVEQQPDDTRIRYMLCMEYANSGDTQGALGALDDLIARSPDYVAGYFLAGRTAEAGGEAAAARDYYRRGIVTALRTGDRHTAAEMQQALDLLGE